MYLSILRIKIIKYTVNKQWGGFVWGTIHEVAIGYPEIPTETDKEEYKQFYDLIMKRRIWADCVYTNPVIFGIDE